MMRELGKLATTGARCTFTVVSRAVAFAALGLALNLVLLAFLLPELSALGSRMGGIPAARAGGPGAGLALLALLVEAWPIVLLVLGLGLAFPAVYLVLGKRHGAAQALAYAARELAVPVADYVLDRAVESDAAQDAARSSAAALLASAGARLPTWLDRLDDLPRPLRLVVRRLLARADVAGLLSALAEEHRARGGDALDLQGVAGVVRERVAQQLRERFLKPSLGWLWVLLLVNLGAFAAIKVAV